MRGPLRLAAISAISITALLGLAAVPLAAAEPAASPRYFMLHQEMARPAMLQQYEDTSKEFVSILRQHHDANPGLSFTGVAGDDYMYSFVGPLDGFAGIDVVNAGFGAVAQAVGEAKWGDLMRRGGQATEYIRESVLLEDPSLSYAPARPRLKPEEVRYLHFDLYYIQPGHEPDAEAVAREFAALFRRKNLDEGYRFLKVVLGPETPLYIVVVEAKDAADYASHDAAGRQVLGDEGKAQFQRAFAVTRRFETHGGWVRPDLSLEPMKAARGK
jgi:hypothetical protein